MSSTLPAASGAIAAGHSRRLRRPPAAPAGVMLACLFLALLIAAAIAPALFTHADPYAIRPREAFHAPAWSHPFGTDQSGRDILTRVIFGARQSLLLGIGATALAMAIAVGLGLAGGLSGRVVERAVARLLEVLFSFPTLILSLLFSASLGVGIRSLIIAVGIGGAAGYGRMVLGQVRAVRHSGFIEAARALGHSPLRVIRRQILPNALRPLVVMITLGIGQNIVWASALSFLGLGAAPPAAEWGTMLAMGRDFVANAWWLTFFPGLLIVLTALSTTVVGRHLQSQLEGGRR